MIILRNAWMLLLVLLIVSCGETDKVRRDRLFLQGNEALANSEYDQAITYFTRAISMDSAFARAYNNRGVARIEDGHPYEAIQDYNMAIRIDKSYWDAIFNRTYAYEQVGRVQDALDDIAQIKLEFPDSAYVHFYEGLLQTRSKNYEAGEVSFKRSISLDSSNLEARVNLATIYYLQGRMPEAKSMLLAVLRSEPNQANALNTLTQIYLTASDFQNALITINQALNIVPSEPYFLNNRGQVYLSMDSLNLALKDINRSIYLNPDNAWAYRNKGIFYMKNGQYPEAVRLFQESIDRDEFIDEVYSYLGMAYYKQGLLKEACEAWRTGQEQKEKNAIRYLSEYCD